MAIKNETLDTVGKDIFICPTNEEHAVTCVVFCNHSASTQSINVYAVPSLGTVSVASQIIKNLSIPASETFTFDTEKFVLGSEDRLHVIASANSSITATVSSMRVS